LFVLVDFDPPLDRLPVETADCTVIATLSYDVVADATPGPTPLRISHREFGAPLVDALFVDDRDLEVFPELTSGEVVICAGGVLELSEVSPDHGAIAGGTEVILTGIGFTEDLRVYFDGREAEVQSVEETEIVVVTSPASCSGLQSVTVESTLGCSSLSDVFELQAPPELSSVTPPLGSGDQVVELVGARFAPETRVFIGTVELTGLTITDSKSIEGFLGSCALQASPGLHSVRVENLFGTVMLSDAFECSSLFIRGDCNGNGRVDISDAIFALHLLFDGEQHIRCDDACDADDDGELQLTDGVAIVRRLFSDGRAFPAPFPTPGNDPTPDELRCVGDFE